MEQRQEKPRVSYAQAFPEKTQGTVAWLIERFIKEMDGLDGRPPVRALGLSHRSTLRRLQRDPIGRIMAAKLRRQDVIEFCRRRLEKVQAVSTKQDVGCLSGVLKYAASAWDDCEKDISDAAIAAAKPFLTKHGLIGRNAPRSRRPTPDEIERICGWFMERQQSKRCKVDMVRVTLWQYYSARRIGETVRLLWEDWNREEQTILVRKMKDPKNRDKQKVVALTVEAQAFLEALWEIRDPKEPRIFPYERQTCISNYVEAKNALGIENLHLHDSRRDCGTRLVEEKGYSAEQAILVTGHETTAIFQRVYLKMKPELFKFGPMVKRTHMEVERVAA